MNDDHQDENAVLYMLADASASSAYQALLDAWNGASMADQQRLLNAVAERGRILQQLKADARFVKPPEAHQ